MPLFLSLFVPFVLFLAIVFVDKRWKKNNPERYRQFLLEAQAIREKRAEEWKRDRPTCFMLAGIGAIAFVIIFWEGFNPSKALFSNDGPVGVMNTETMRNAVWCGPGTQMWQDVYWLGNDWGEVPINFSYLLMFGAARLPQILLLVAMFFVFKKLWKLYKYK